VPFLSLVWRCNLAITNSQVQYLTSSLYIIKNNLVIISISSGSWGGLTFVRLAIEIWVLDRVALKGEDRKWGGEWGNVVGTAGFCGPCVFLL
jgi:hypothetical protein